MLVRFPNRDLTDEDYEEAESPFVSGEAVWELYREARPVDLRTAIDELEFVEEEIREEGRAVGVRTPAGRELQARFTLLSRRLAIMRYMLRLMAVGGFQRDPKSPGAGLSLPELKDASEEVQSNIKHVAWSYRQNGFTDAGWLHFTAAYRLISVEDVIPGANGDENPTAIFRAVAQENGVGIDTVRKSAADHRWHDPNGNSPLRTRQLIKERAKEIPESILVQILKDTS